MVKRREAVVVLVAPLTALLIVVAVVVAVDDGHPPVYMNDVAVHVPGGEEVAHSIARKHGFVNIGKIGSLQDFYLFRHHRIRKRSINQAHHHVSKLTSEPQILWAEQQTEKKRVKRDGQEFFPALSALFDVNEFPSFFDSRERTSHRQVPRKTPRRYSDPMYEEQWYLHTGAKDGNDMNVIPAWNQGVTGKGVVVSILDDGIQPNHPDLAFNYDALASYDINSEDNDPTPTDDGKNKHGTRCAGEVASIAGNGICGVGVAFNSSIGGVRMLDGPVNDYVEAKALSLNRDHIDIYSASWGPEDDGKTVDGPGPLAKRAFIEGVVKGRRGRGSIFVWASGNGGRFGDSCNCDGYTNSIFTLSISSASQGGNKPWYLEECASTLATTYSSGTPREDKSVATCDQDAKLRPNFICTASHTGTSASAPMAAGICALALEVNSGLTWRDMQHIVVLTSRPQPLLHESGWLTNGVHKKVSHKFGYGLMDAGAMVNLARQWVTVPDQHICVTQPDSTQRVIPNSRGSRLEVSMTVGGCQETRESVRFLEHVQCKVSLTYVPRGNLRIMLTSPAGTVSTLLFERPRDVINGNFDRWPFMSVHFWGENPVGHWTITIMDAGNRVAKSEGSLKEWQLIFYGTDTDPVKLRGMDREHSYPEFVAASFTPSSGFPDFFTQAESSVSEIYSTVDGRPVQNAEGKADCVASCDRLCADPSHAECRKCRKQALRDGAPSKSC